MKITLKMIYSFIMESGGDFSQLSKCHECDESFSFEKVICCPQCRIFSCRKCRKKHFECKQRGSELSDLLIYASEVLDLPSKNSNVNH